MKEPDGVHPGEVKVPPMGGNKPWHPTVLETRKGPGCPGGHQGDPEPAAMKAQGVLSSASRAGRGSSCSPGTCSSPQDHRDLDRGVLESRQGLGNTPGVRRAAIRAVLLLVYLCPWDNAGDFSAPLEGMGVGR